MFRCPGAIRGLVRLQGCGLRKELNGFGAAIQRRRAGNSQVETAAAQRKVIGELLARQAHGYLTLGKVKLTGLVAFTASVGFIVSGGPVFSLAHACVFGGTFLQSMSANTFNQVAERDFDKLMKRTDKRPMVTGIITPVEARRMATAWVTLGTAGLYAVDPVAAGLGVACWALYVHGYTPMKRIHWLNTWVGAVVGALPPMMGCCGAGLAVLSPESVFLGLFLYFWQIPHFLSLCYLNRRDYKAAGFKMLPQIDIQKAGTYSVRYATYTTATASVLPLYFGIATPYFAVESLAFGVYWMHAAVAFKDKPLPNARRLFLISIMYLPVLLILLMIHSTKANVGISPKLFCPVASSD